MFLHLSLCLRGGGGIPACLAGFQAYTQGGSWGVWLGGSPGPHPGRSPGPPLGWVSPGPSPGGLQAHTQGTGGARITPGGVCRYPRMHWGRPPDGYCCRQYASYWNAFLFSIYLSVGKLSLCKSILIFRAYLNIRSRYLELKLSQDVTTGL